MSPRSDVTTAAAAANGRLSHRGVDRTDGISMRSTKRSGALGRLSRWNCRAAGARQREMPALL